VRQRIIIPRFGFMMLYEAVPRDGLRGTDEMMCRNGRFLIALIAASIAMRPGVSLAQTPPASSAPPSRSEFETRAELEEQARIAEAEHRTGEAWLLRSRLEKGDFQEGDRIVVTAHSIAFKVEAETLVVRAGKVIQLPRMGEFSVDGVLRSELNDRFMQHLAKYVRDSEARTTPLIRVGVQGGVNRPGYYYFSPDLVLNDVIMRAGGPGGDADLNKVTINRGPDVIWDRNGTRTALTEGLSLDRLHIRAGDEVMVPTKRHIPWFTIVGLGISVRSIAVTLTQLHR
jgi:protein involved in polysaccharide export with SLBB domain